MAKNKRSTEKKLTRRQRSRRDKDAQVKRTLLWSAIGVGALIILIIGYGLLNEYVIKARTPVAKVGDTTITTREFQSRLDYQRIMAQLQLNQYQRDLSKLNPNDPSQQMFYQQYQMIVDNLENQLSPEMEMTFADQLLDQIIEETLIRQEAEEQGIIVPDPEVQQEIELMLGYDRNATITETEILTGANAPVTKAEFQETYQGLKENVLQPTNFSEERYRQLIKTELLRERLIEVLGQDVARVAEQVQLFYLTAGTEEQARELRARLTTSDTVETLREELMADEDDQTTAQTLPWLPKNYLEMQLGPEIADVAFNTPVETASSPILSTDTPMGENDVYYVIYVMGYEEERPLREDFVSQAKQEKYLEWLEAEKAEKVEKFDWEKALNTSS
jgi:hypothetical protein